MRGQYQKASSLLSQLPDPRDQTLHMRWLVDRADLLRRQNRLAEANQALDEVDRLAGSKGVGDSAFKSLLLRSALLLRAGQFDEAEDVLGRLLVRTKEAGDSYNRAGALLNLSFSKLKRQRYDEAIEYGRQALELAASIHASRIAGAANNNLGIAYTVLRDLDQAAEHTNTAIAQFREIDDRSNLGDALGELGNIHLLDHKPELAVPDFEGAFDIAKGTDDTVAEVRWAGRLAFAQIDRRDWSAAESWNRQAYALREKLKDPEKNDPYLQLNAAAIANGSGDSKKAEALYRELIGESKGVPYIEWDAHLRLGSLFANQQRSREANTEYEHGLEAIERVQAGFIKDDDRLTYHDLQMEFFKDYVDLLVSEGDVKGALQVAEYSRARVLAEKLGVQPGAIGQVHPADFQSYARRTGSVLLSYWLAPKRSFVWVIKPDSVRMRELPAANEIGELIRDYRKTIDEQQRDPVDERLPKAEHLSEVLLGPLRGDLAGARRVVIVPDEEIHALNLETLPAADAGRYWIEDVEIAVAPSLSVLAETPPRSRSKPSLLLVGDPVSAGPQYPPLPSAKAEIDKIQRRFAGASLVLTGLDASPRGFLDATRTPYSMIHFAAHAEANPQSPLESAVILSMNGNAYKLYARDVARLKLSADLVTISACRSAGARAYGGEGLVGFAWAFLQSGAGAVIAGLWDVSDSSSSQFMDKLYESLAAGAEPPAALRLAKLTLLHSSGPYRKPFYWAPYQIYIR